jgi:predicted nucleotidyltransferase
MSGILGLDNIVNCYKNYLGDHLISMVLFGSHARGDSKATSDYDLFIIAEQLPSRPFQRMLFIRKPLTGQFEQKLCIIAKTPEEVLKYFPPLLLDIGEDRIVLFDRNDFFKKLQERIKNIIDQACVQRKEAHKEFYWEWQNPSKKGWEITWSGYREL